jgi:hypothetical protein
LQNEKGVSAPDWVGSITSVPDRAMSTSLSCDSAGVTPVHSATAHARSPDRPTWGTMKDYGDDVRIDKEWGEWGKDAVRKARDDKMRGRSPPPREKKGPADRMCEGGPWGEASAESAPGWGSPRRGSPDLAGSGKEESSSKDLEPVPEPKRPWNRTRRSVRVSRSSASTEPPKLVSEGEDSTFLVRVKKVESKANVLFLNSEKTTGWEGPFDMLLTVEDLIDVIARPAPKAHTWPASVMESEPSSEGEGSEGSDRSEGKKESPFEKGLDPHLEGGRGAGYLELVESAKKAGTGYRNLMAKEKMTQAQWEAIYWEQREEWNALDPRFKVRDVVFWYHKTLGIGKWSRAIVEKVILPTELQYREGWTFIVYQIVMTPMGDENFEPSIAKESNLRPSLWGDPTTYSCMPSNIDALHSMEVVGIDTCSALSVSTREEDFLFLDRSLQATESVVLRGVGGSDAKIGGRGPMAVLAADDYGREIVLVDPAGVYLAEAVDQANFRILGQQRLKRFGFDLVQNGDRDGKDHLVYKGGRVRIPLGEESGILTLATKPMALDPEERKALDDIVDKLLVSDNPDNDEHYIHVSDYCMVMNEAYLTRVEQDRLMHWRTAHRVSLKPGPKGKV